MKEARSGCDSAACGLAPRSGRCASTISCSLSPVISALHSVEAGVKIKKFARLSIHGSNEPFSIKRGICLLSLLLENGLELVPYFLGLHGGLPFWRLDIAVSDAAHVSHLSQVVCVLDKGQ